MAFTFAFFSIPAAFFLFIHTLLNPGRKTVLKVALSITLVALTALLFCVEASNVRKSNHDLIGRFYFRKDTFSFKQDNTYVLNQSNKIQERGNWKLFVDGKLLVDLNNGTLLELVYQNGKPVLNRNADGKSQAFQKLN